MDVIVLPDVEWRLKLNIDFIEYAAADGDDAASDDV